MPSSDLLCRVAFEALHLPERTRRLLLDRLKTARAVFAAGPGRLAGIGLSGDEVRIVREFRFGRLERLCVEQERRGVWATWPGLPSYPRLLAETASPPRLLMVHGTLEPDEECVAVVGSRQATPYGLAVARWLGADLVRLGATLVSGAARGVDGASQRAALEAGGRTVAVLGCGIDVAYPREHARLLDEIARSGAVVSEFPPGESPRRRNFPRRNRIISGLSRAVVVVEAGGNSGSLITAGQAADQNRQVFAVPHNLDTEGGGGDGPNSLIRAGATLLTRAEDVLEHLSADLQKRFSRQRKERSAILRKQDGETDVPEGLEEILEALSFHTPRQADQLAERTGLEPGMLLRSLTELELEGLVEKLPGLRFVRRRGY